MATFVGRSGNHILFSDDSGEQGVVVDSRYGIVVASGALKDVEVSDNWDTGTFTEYDERAAVTALLSSATTKMVPTGRLYTIPRGVRNEARRALDWYKSYERGTTPAGLATASLLASGGQVDFKQLQNIHSFFSRNHNVRALENFDTITEYGPADERIEWATRGGDSARNWAESIVSREVPEPEGNDILTFEDILEQDPEASVEFIARVRLDGSGIDRLYKVDVDDSVYAWDGDSWESLGLSDQTIWSLDRALDNGEILTDVTHVMIDAESAVTLSARLKDNPFGSVSIEDIAPEEAGLVADAIDDEDWDIVDSVITEPVTAAGAPGTDANGDGIYSEEERSENASKQVRDRTGKFAKVGTRVSIAGDESVVGNITKVDPSNGTVTVDLEDGRTVNVPGRSVQAAPIKLDNPAIPGRPAETPGKKLDMSGILAEPRTPVNRVGAQIPGTLPQMTPEDLHTLINDWPAWVKSQRDAFKPAGKDSPVQVDHSGKNSDPYAHPLIQRWLKRNNNAATYRDNKTFSAVTAAAMSPSESDVDAIYLAIVAPDDPRAVLTLVSLVPAGDDTTQPMTYIREEGTWKREPGILSDLNSATPPPVVPLDKESLESVLEQMDDPESVEEVPETESVTEPVAASAVPADDDTMLDHRLMVLFGPRSALVAAGQANKAAEEVRNYWTSGLGAEKIQWDTPGDWGRAVRYLGKYMGSDAKIYARDLHQELSTQTESYTMDRPLLEFYADEDSVYDNEFIPDSSIRNAMGEAFGDSEENWESMLEDQDIPWNEAPHSLRAAGGLDRNRGGAEQLRHYWTRGAGAAKIRWGTPGDWTRCVRHLSKHMGVRAKGYCALRHKETTGMWTGDKANLQILSRTANTTVLSTDSIDDTDAVVASALLRAKAQHSRDRIVASAVEDIKGARFVIPLVIPEGVESGDGRIAKDEAVDLRDLPLPLMWQEKTAEGHDGSYVVGRIDFMERIEGGIGNAYGYFDTGAYGREAERMVRQGFLRGVSVDLDRFEAASEPSTPDPADMADPATVKSDKLTITKARVMGVTIVAKPAFQECRIFLEEEPILQEEIVNDIESVDPLEASALVACGYVAGSIPLTPPKSWFSNPELNQPTPITLTDDGRVFGHIAAWHTDHIGMTFGTKAPRSRSKYAYFHTGVLRTDEGDDVEVGQLTLAGGHASMSASAQEAVKHYDDTASAIADVHAGEDQFGIWVSGSIRPGTTPQQIRAFRASAPSGDWRPIKGHLELVAVCQVNVPGFPVPRARVASGGIVTSLVAAGAPALAQMYGDSRIELAARASRLELEHFAKNELALRAATARAKVTEARIAHAEALSAKAEALSARFSSIAGKPTAKVQARLEAEALIASAADARARVAASRSKTDKVQREEIEKIAKEVDPTIVDGTPVGDEVDSPKASPESGKGRYTPDTQPRDDDGKFRLILARLRDNLGTSGNQKVLDKIKAVENLDNTGDYKQAAESAADLINTIERIDTGALNPDAITNIRSATTDLSKVVANLPLPFENQAQKVRFSDLPPALREMIKTFVTKVETRIEGEDGREATAPLRSLMSGGDVYSQSEISSELNKMLRLLT